MKKLSDFKKEIKALGYRVKTHLHRGSSLGGNSFTCLEVLDSNKQYVVGSGGNVYSSETILQHEKVFDLLNNNRNQIIDDSYEPPLKVVF